MDKKALVYMNLTGNEVLDKQAHCMMEDYCTQRGIIPVLSYADDTDKSGMGEPIKYMCIGLVETDTIDLVVTMFAEMLGANDVAILETLARLEDHGLFVETVADDIGAYYDKLYDEAVPDESEECRELMHCMKMMFRA